MRSKFTASKFHKPKSLVILSLYVAVLAGVSFLLFHNLGSHSISLRSDEVVYARVTQGIVQSGDFWNLNHGSAPFYHKPPLKFIVGSIAPMIFGESNLTYRIADAVIGLLCFIAVLLLSYALFRNHLVSILSVVLTASSLELMIEAHSFRRATLDGLLVLLSLCAAMISWEMVSTQTSRSRIYVRAVELGIILGGCILTKSVGGLVPLGCVVVTLLTIASQNKYLRRISCAIVLVAVSLVVAAVYYVPLLVSSDKARSVVIGGEVLHRAFQGYQGHNTGDPLFYLRYMFQKSGVIPSGFLLLSLITVTKFWRTSSVRFLLIWGFLPVILYSFSASKTPWYISIAVPFIAILVAEMISNTAHLATVQRALFRRVLCVGWLLLVGFGSFQLIQKYRLIFSTIQSQTVRLPMDLLVEEVLSKNQTYHLTLLDNAIPGGTAPKNGRFNVEGIYRQMLQPHITKINDIRELRCVTKDCILITPRQLESIPDGFKFDRMLPPYGARSYEAYVYRGESSL